MTTAYDVALGMLEGGVQCIPLNESKRPMLNFADVTITKDFINRNEEYQRARALGVLTRGLWCIDIDKHGGTFVTGYYSMGKIPYYDELDCNAKKTWIQQTPTGGMHIIFKKREGIEYSQHNGYLKNVDIKANDNNFFVMGGSVTKAGIYNLNAQEPILYDGEFEERIFNREGSTFEEQVIAKLSLKNVLPQPTLSSYQPRGKGGRGKQAYQRIIEGVSETRNEDLFLAASYAKTCNIAIEPLTVLIGDVKGRDRFTEKEFWKTVASARA